MIKHLTPREFKFPEKGIEVVCYDGAWPNLCSGTLVMAVNGKLYTFASHALSSGGSVSFDEEWQEDVTDGEWGVNEWPEGFPEDCKNDALDCINSSIPWGCCGGCV